MEIEEVNSEERPSLMKDEEEEVEDGVEDINMDEEGEEKNKNEVVDDDYQHIQP